MINDVVDEKHPPTVITKHVHKHTQLWNSKRWWSFGDIVIAGSVWSACCMLRWSGYHWRRALVTHPLWRASYDVYEKHMWSGQWEEKYDSSNHLWQFSVKCNPAKHTHTHTQSDWIFFYLTQTYTHQMHLRIRWRYNSGCLQNRLFCRNETQTHEHSLNKSPLYKCLYVMQIN